MLIRDKPVVKDDCIDLTYYLYLVVFLDLLASWVAIPSAKRAFKVRLCTLSTVARGYDILG